jgi:nicotinamidase-related amidase
MWENYDEVKKRYCDLHIKKSLPGSFTGTGLGQWIRDNSISVLTIACYMNQMCCDSTACELSKSVLPYTFSQM